MKVKLCLSQTLLQVLVLFKVKLRWVQKGSDFDEDKIKAGGEGSKIALKRAEGENSLGTGKILRIKFSAKQRGNFGNI